MTVTAVRYHDISCGHRVVGHESKCRHLHGHNYRVTFTLELFCGTDDIGRVLDFSVIKSKLCMWLEENWDHKFLAWENDPVMRKIDSPGRWAKDELEIGDLVSQSIVWLPFNPTAENMATHLLDVVGPQQLEGTGCILTHVTVEETRKCSATASL